MNSIRDTIRSIIAGETDRHLIVNTDSFLIGLFRHPLKKDESRLKLIANFVLLLGAVIACIVAIVCSFVFFIDDVLLFRPQVRINQQGAFVPTNSCGREYVLFIFNSADPWASTGIQLCEGDRIKISASGAFNSAIRQTADAALENTRNPYPWYGSHIRKRMEIADPGEKDEIGKCIYNAPDNARFGSILYQIQPDAVPCEFDNRNRRIHQLSVQDGENFREVRENGILHFAVNDIYLTPAVIDAFAEENRKKFCGADTVVLTRDVQRLVDRDSLKLYKKIPGKPDRLCVAGDGFKAWFGANRDAWFRDNLGEILINVEIQRKLTRHQFWVHGIVDWYRGLETNVEMAGNSGCWLYRLFKQTLCAGFGLLKLLVVPIVWVIALLIGSYWLIVFRPWTRKKESAPTDREPDHPAEK